MTTRQPFLPGCRRRHPQALAIRASRLADRSSKHAVSRYDPSMPGTSTASRPDAWDGRRARRRSSGRGHGMSLQHRRSRRCIRRSRFGPRSNPVAGPCRTVRNSGEFEASEGLAESSSVGSHQARSSKAVTPSERTGRPHRIRLWLRERSRQNSHNHAESAACRKAC
jgi:hypothetical protein